MSEYQTNVMMAKLGVHYGSPDPKDPKRAQAIISEYARLMAQYTDNELTHGADLVLRRHKFKTWPSIAECVNAVEDYRASVREKNVPELGKASFQYPAWSDARKEKADVLIKCELGCKAAQEGWLLSLHDFCRNHERLPVDREIPALMASARFLDRFMAGEVDRSDLDLPPTIDGEISLQMDSGLRGMLRRLGESLLAKREKLRAEVLGR